MGKKRVLISYGVDVDAVAGWLGSYGGEDSTSDISRGTYERALPQRLIDVLTLSCPGGFNHIPHRCAILYMHTY